MGNLVFQATLGGQVSLVGPNTASTFTLNVPAVSSTLATLAAQTFTGTQTMSTLTSPAATNLLLQSAGTTAVTIDASQNVGVGVTPSAWSTANSVKALQVGSAASLWSYSTTNSYVGSNYYWNGTNRIYLNTTLASEYAQEAGVHIWKTAPSGTAGNAITFTQAMTLDTSGVLSVPAGVKPYQLIGSAVANNISWDGAQFYPQSDNTNSNGYPGKRWTVIYAANGTINTSDANQKQDIAKLDSIEKLVAIRIKSLIKKYRFKDAVVKKGDDARIHVGAIAQEIAAAFVAEGLDPTRYGLFCSDTWYEVDGKMSDDLINNPYTAETEGAVECTQLGLRYDELLAFVIAAL